MGRVAAVDMPASGPCPEGVTPAQPCRCDRTMSLPGKAPYPARRETLERGISKAASDGAAGSALARKIRPHIILPDVTMARMDGWSVLGALRSDPALSGTPVTRVNVLRSLHVRAKRKLKA